MVITEQDVQHLSIRTMLDAKKVREIVGQCNLLGDILNLDLGAKDKRLESLIKDTIFIEILKLRKGKECRI